MNPIASQENHMLTKAQTKNNSILENGGWALSFMDEAFDFNSRNDTNL